jgi:hypothetical protein
MAKPHDEKQCGTRDEHSPHAHTDSRRPISLIPTSSDARGRPKKERAAGQKWLSPSARSFGPQKIPAAVFFFLFAQH